MYLIFFDPSRLTVDIPKVSGLNLKAFNGSMVIRGQELKHIKETARYIWRSILNKTGLDSFRGLIRFDLAPQFNGEKKLIRWQNLPVFDIGELSIAGIYEINTHSPECMAAIAALHYASPIHSWHQPNIGERLAQIIEKRVGQDIIFIPGDNPIKQAWGQYLIISLKAAGLNVVQGKMEDLLQQEKISLPIWRWGDARLGKGPSEYPLSFQHWLLKQPLVFNSLPKTQDPGDKSLLADKGTGYWNNLVGENFILSPQTAQQALKRQKDLVLKPLKGSSGNGLIFGPLVSAQEWKQAIEKKPSTSKLFMVPLRYAGYQK